MTVQELIRYPNTQTDCVGLGNSLMAIPTVHSAQEGINHQQKADKKCIMGKSAICRPNRTADR